MVTQAGCAASTPHTAPAAAARPKNEQLGCLGRAAAARSVQPSACSRTQQGPLAQRASQKRTIQDGNTVAQDLSGWPLPGGFRDSRLLALALLGHLWAPPKHIAGRDQAGPNWVTGARESRVPTLAVCRWAHPRKSEVLGSSAILRQTAARCAVGSKYPKRPNGPLHAGGSLRHPLRAHSASFDYIASPDLSLAVLGVFRARSTRPQRKTQTA